MTQLGDVALRVTHLYDYLSALALELSRSPVRALAEYDPPQVSPQDLPAHPSVRLASTSQSGEWLTVKRVAAPVDCQIPEDLEPYLQDVVTTNPYIAPMLPADWEQAAEDLGDDPGQVLEAFNAWLADSWRAWAARAELVLQSRKLYETLYNLRLRLQQNQATHELMWGFGVLTWSVEGSTVQHPALLAAVRIELDGEDGTIRVIMDSAPSLDLDFLQGLDVAQLVDLVGLREALRAAPPDPWAPGGMTGVYEQIIAPLGVDATLGSEAIPRSATAQPVLSPTWRLFMRKRPVRFQRFYADLRDAISEQEDIPDPIAAVVASESDLDAIRLQLATAGMSDAGVDRDDARAEDWTAVGERLLMPLPTNEDQERIALQLATRRGVTVQGPPGTGKSHTIANLICHLVAHGKRVLVTAHNEQALTVLRDKIPVEMRDYSISVLGSSQTAIGELRASVQTIMDVVSEVHPEKESTRIGELANELDAARQRARAAELRLLELLRQETSEYTLPSGSTKAAAVARWIADHADEDGHIPDAIAPGTACPLSIAELLELYQLAAAFSADDARSAMQVLPRAADLPPASELIGLHEELDGLRDDMADLDALVVSWEVIDARGSSGLAAFRVQLQADRDRLATVSSGWKGVILQQVLTNPQQATFWSEQSAALHRLTGTLLELSRPLVGHDVRLPAGDPRVQLEQLAELKARFAQGKGVPKMLHREMKELHSAVTVEGLAMRTVAEVELAETKVRAQQARDALARHWDEVRQHCDGPASDPTAITFSADLDAKVRDIDDVLAWVNTDQATAVSHLREVLLNVPDVLTDQDMATLDSAAIGAVKRVRERELSARLADLTALLAQGSAAADASPRWDELALALSARDWPAWTTAQQEAARLTALTPAASRRLELSQRLAEVAPAWSAAIVANAGDHQLLGDPARLDRMWTWRQAESWLEDLLSRGDAQALQRQIDEENETVRRLVLDLSVRSARVAVKQNLKDDQRQALVAWLTALAKIGKGTGKYAPMWQAEARRMMPGAMGAVPVWIMPIHRVLESFDPRVTEPFDVVIVDESSQCDVLTVGILGLGKKAVVVGDDRQISPAAVGVDQSAVFRLIQTHLSDLPNAMLLDAQASLYDTAARVYPGVVLLKEHFRCVPEIIGFSNRFYDGQILPLREDADESLGNPLRLVRVPDGVRTRGQYGEANEPEAEALVDQVVACCRDPHYDGMSMGVIALLQGGQARLIEQLLLQKLGAEEIERRNIRVGDPYNFQGDERDIIFISVVADDNRSAATRRADEQRINVAASRARNQLWVFHSVDESLLRDDDVRGQLIRYARDHDTVEAQIADLAQLCESDFERAVLRQLLERGYKVKPQFKVGRFRIDLVVQGYDDRLAIECDGEAFHGDDKIEDDLRRQRILQRLGWKFWRVRGAAFYRDPTAALAALWERLAELEILPGAARPPGRSEQITPAAWTEPAADQDDDGQVEIETIDELEDWDEPEDDDGTRLFPLDGGSPTNGASIDPADVRAWAKSQGIPVGVRGRISKELVTLYRAAQHG